MPSRGQRYKRAAKKFAQETSGHGFSRIADVDKSLLYRLFWLTMTLAGLVVALYNCTIIIISYLSQPYYMSESVEMSASVPNPDVTVCNAFQFPNLGADSIRTHAVMDDLKEKKCFDNDTMKGFLYDQLGTTAYYLLFSALDGVVENVSMPASSLIVNCFHGHLQCTANDFKRYIDSQFYSCYTFSMEGDLGVNSELNLLLYLSSDTVPGSYNYSDIMPFNAKGAYIQVHERGTRPNVMRFGTTLSPGTKNAVRLQAHSERLLESPFATNCTTQEYLHSGDNYKYDMDSCYFSCYADMMASRCGCVIAEVHPYTANSADTKLCFNDLCDADTVYTEAECISDMMTSFNDDFDCTHCHQSPCESWSYPLSVASLTYLTDQVSIESFILTYLNDYHVSIDDLFMEFGNYSNLPSNFVADNYILVNIFFNNFRLTRKVAKEAMSTFSMISSIGGALGLWAGFSVLTLVEVLEWLVSAITLICFKEKVEAESKKISASSSQLPMREAWH